MSHSDDGQDTVGFALAGVLFIDIVSFSTKTEFIASHTFPGAIPPVFISSSSGLGGLDLNTARARQLLKPSISHSVYRGRFFGHPPC
jgi:hypothetical protein